MMNQVCDRGIMSLCLGTLPRTTLLYYFNGHVTIRVDIILLTFVLILKVRMGTEVYEAPSDENLVGNSVKWFISS